MCTLPWLGPMGTASPDPERCCRCFFAQFVAPFVESPLFALQSQFDAYQTSAEIGSREPAVVNPYASNLTATLEQSLSLLGAKGKNGAFRECLALRSSVAPV